MGDFHERHTQEVLQWGQLTFLPVKLITSILGLKTNWEIEQKTKKTKKKEHQEQRGHESPS